MSTTTVTTCTYDSGAMTDCQPLCDSPATHEVTYTNGSVFVALVCKRHVRPTENRVYDSLVSTQQV